MGKKLVDNQPKTTRVVTAVADFKIGTVLRAQDLTTNELGGTIPKGAILKPEDAIGRGVVSNIYQGEPIVESRLAPPGSGGGLAATIKQGMRAMAIKVDDVVGVAGFVTPGMRVDVLVSGNPPDNGNERIWARRCVRCCRISRFFPLDRISRKMPKANRFRCKW